MNKILKYSLSCAIVLLSLVYSYANDNTINNIYSDEEIRLQIESLSSHMNLEYNQEVKSILNSYMTTYRRSTETIINRSHYYFPIIEKIIEKHNLPQEIKYLSVVESSLNPIIRSKAGAVGLWQFMRSTARMYGLKVGNYYDERRDVTLSTEAALVYLNDLYEKFGDWTLAMAAYNCGPGNVSKAIRRANSNDYWKVRRYLPRETRRYLPKFVAYSYIMTYANDLGFGISEDQFTEYTSFASSTVYAKTNLSYVSEHSGVPVSEIIKYNPAYNHRLIPAREGGSTLILPEHAMLKYLHSTDQMYALEHVFYIKNSTFYNSDDEFIYAEKLELEDDEQLIERKAQHVQPLYTQSLDYLEEKPIEVMTVSEPEIIAVLDYKRIRLRKRQTVKDIIRTNTEVNADPNSLVMPASQVLLRVKR